MDTHDAETLLNDIDDYISDAGERLAQGNFVSLGELNSAVDELCQRVLEVRADKAQHLVPKLEEMRNRLDTLQQAMEVEKSRLTTEMGSTGQRQKAAHAYCTPTSKS